MITLIGYYDILQAISKLKRYAREKEIEITFGLNLDNKHPNVLKKEVDKLINTGEKDFNFHSCHGDLFNIFGHYVAYGKLKPEDIKIYLVTDEGEVLEPYYDEEGFLNNWRIGFFNWGWDW